MGKIIDRIRQRALAKSQGPASCNPLEGWPPEQIQRWLIDVKNQPMGDMTIDRDVPTPENLAADQYRFDGIKIVITGNLCKTTCTLDGKEMHTLQGRISSSSNFPEDLTVTLMYGGFDAVARPSRV